MTDEQLDNVNHRRINIDFSACPRYDKHELSEEDILRIAKLAVKLAKEDSDMEIGRLTKKGFYWLIGAIVMGTYTWLTANGIIK
jgi:hypothetical protein